MLQGRDQDLAAEMAAFLFGNEPILEAHAHAVIRRTCSLNSRAARSITLRAALSSVSMKEWVF